MAMLNKNIMKLCYSLIIVLSIVMFSVSSSFAAEKTDIEGAMKTDNNSPQISSSDLKSKNATCASKGKTENKNQNDKLSDGHGIVPDSVISAIYTLNNRADQTVKNFLILGHSVLCYAGHFGAVPLEVANHKLMYIPNIPMAISGIMIWILGILLSMIIAYYLVDVAFKLGFAMLAMPIGLALWPFPPTKGYLFKIINIIFHTAGVFIFLCLGIAYAISLFLAALEGPDFETIYGYINAGKTKEVSEIFNLGTTRFLLLLFAGVYGFRLVGESVNKYVKKFFPSTLADLNPMHQRLTQVTDFAKQKVGRAAGYVGDVAKTQIKRGAAAVSKSVGQGISRAGNNLGGATGGFINRIGRGMQYGATKFEHDYQTNNLGKGKKDKEKGK